MKLNLYVVSDKYIKYLRKFDDKIYDNKEEKRTKDSIPGAPWGRYKRNEKRIIMRFSI